MQMVRGCLMTLGLILLSMVTSCVLGVSSCSRALNPTEFGATVDEHPDKARRMLREYLAAATSESGTLKIDDAPAEITVIDFTDGSLHLIAAQDGQPLLTVVATFAPKAPDRTRIEVVSEGEAMARAVPRLGAAALHRALKDDIETAFDAIDRHQVMPRGLLLSRVRDHAWSR